MVKKAENLKSISELELSTETRNFINQIIDQGKLSLEQVVLDGRIVAYGLKWGFAKPPTPSVEWRIEVATALDKAGYIRHDLEPRVFDIADLYNYRYELYFDTPGHLPTNIRELAASGLYEKFTTPTDEQYKKLGLVLKERLPEEEFQVMSMRYGLENNIPRDVEYVQQELGLSFTRVLQLEVRAFMRLRSYGSLPPLFDSSEASAKVDELIDEINKLRQDQQSIFDREEELRQELSRWVRSPFVCAEKARRYLNGEQNHNGIELLDLKAGTHKCLKRAGVRTIAEAFQYPQDKWGEIENLSLSGGQEEIRNKLNSLSTLNTLS